MSHFNTKNEKLESLLEAHRISLQDITKGVNDIHKVTTEAINSSNLQP
jgi:hypothetical protein